MLLALALCSALAAGEPGRPALGLSIDTAVAFDAAAGLPVLAVRTGSPAESLGLRPGDRLLALNTVDLAAPEDLARVTATLNWEQAIEVRLRRAEAELTLRGTLPAAPNVADLARRAEDLERRNEALRAAGPADGRYTLPDLLLMLRQIQHEVPQVAADFKRQYPQGRFRIRIEIDISSDEAEAATPAEPTPTLTPEPTPAPTPAP